MSEMQQNLTKLFTIPKIAKILQIPYRPLLDSVEKGEIPFHKIGTSRRLLSIEDVLSHSKQAKTEEVHG